MPVQVFGIKKNADTRKALRFFSERRIETHFVDFKVRPPSPGELRRFAQRFGVEALVDRSSRRFNDLGLQHARYTDERWLEKLSNDPMLLVQPLVRNGGNLTIGAAEKEWADWVA